MQKFTCEELWRIGFVRSPGRRTDNVMPVPGANPLPTPVAGLQMIDIRRPFSGAGRLARRSTSASISSFDTIKRRSEKHTSELQSRPHLVCRLLLEKKKNHAITSLVSRQYGLCGLQTLTCT